GLFYFQTKKYNDKRGYFSEIVNLPELEQVIGHPFNIKQVNQARSQKNVVRGMHAEGWNKLVTVNSGLIFSVIADIRPDSVTYKQTEYFQLGFDQNEEHGCGLYISQGLANSICTLEGPVNYLYLVDRLYSERDEKDNLSISIFDPDLNIAWPIEKEIMILSKRDKTAVELKDLRQ
ncbi:MAG: dTDP-4-dehydrorhamnose 3,5-epimerase family protein, partial [Patescibacteria group bacterium]|nr:dTDP-4-dehydrorhamnose 3,5-epimerase family protein [Patescibacteria group bacterium]